MIRSLLFHRCTNCKFLIQDRRYVIIPFRIIILCLLFKVFFQNYRAMVVAFCLSSSLKGLGVGQVNANWLHVNVLSTILIPFHYYLT